MGLVYAGIDEAGYGPLLGPLCSGLAVLRVRDGAPQGGPPDLWAMLGEIVCRDPSDAGTSHIAIADSKRLKLPNDGARHPLLHLERGVLAFAACGREGPETDAALLDRLGADLHDRPWYQGGAHALPVATTHDHLRLLAGRLRAVAADAGVEVLDLRARIADEVVFNRMLVESGGKGGAAMRLVADLAARIWRSDAALDPIDPPRIVIDRQGGRTRYASTLGGLFPGVTVETVAETGAGSVYDLHQETPHGVRRVRISFVQEAEDQHFPVALASMIAKLVRELIMGRFNRYWCGRIAELKPTAGYVADARRWLADVRRLAPDTPEPLLRSLCRDA